MQPVTRVRQVMAITVLAMKKCKTRNAPPPLPCEKLILIQRFRLLYVTRNFTVLIRGLSRERTKTERKKNYYTGKSLKVLMFEISVKINLQNYNNVKIYYSTVFGFRPFRFCATHLDDGNYYNTYYNRHNISWSWVPTHAFINNLCFGTIIFYIRPVHKILRLSIQILVCHN